MYVSELGDLKIPQGAAASKSPPACMATRPAACDFHATVERAASSVESATLVV